MASDSACYGLDERIVAAFEKIAQVSRVLLWEKASSENISPLQLQLLLYIDASPEELRRVGAVAREFDLTPATVSDALSSLESKGLISKRHGEDDRRSVILTLTGDGKKAVQSLEGWKDIFIEEVGAFSEDQKETVMAFLSGLIVSLFDRGVLANLRICSTCSNLIGMGQADEPRFKCAITGRLFNESGLMLGCAEYSMRQGHYLKA